MIKSLLSLLNYREKTQLIFIGIGVLVTSFIELLSIGVLLPLVSILMGGDYSFLGKTLESYINNYKREEIIIISCVFIIILYFIKNIYLYLYNYVLSRYSRNIQHRISSDLFTKYINEINPVYNKKNSGTLIRNINASGTVGLFLFSFLILIVEVSIILFLMIFLLNVNFALTLAVIIIFSLAILILYFSTKRKLFEFNSLKEKITSVVNQESIQSLRLIKIIKIFKKEKLFSKKFTKSNFKKFDYNFKSEIILHVPKLLIETLVVISVCLIIIYMISLGNSSKEIIPLITIYAASAVRLMPSSTRIITSLQRLKAYLPALTIIYNEFNVSGKKVEKIDEVNFTFSKLEFKDLSFRYNENKILFKNQNFKIEKGEMIGIYGESGSGKSTLANLIVGLIQPTSGKIIYDNEIENNSKNKFTPIVGYVPQNTALFDDTIWNNITFFENKDDNGVMRKFNEVVKLSNLKTFIDSLPNKEDTNLGEGFSKVSGGQAQRIGIARALFISSDFLIFDESTSALDSDNENEVIKTINSLKKLKTIIVISHRSELFENCDKIYQIKDNGIYLKNKNE
tara:strand:- start:131 stop:1837 length:1707 start_codon:yes stop_codon:yes gene_type:complete